ncbi:MAG TPA: aminomethyltransferase beta-barrel domain-containing protein, partial [Longimicrobiales bacterium]|nr:aminomethyltransferase beta-barrel domain-containing protein [Longimicrobiales bacterium]
PGDTVAVQLRHRAPEVPATVVDLGSGLSLDLARGVAAVTPGQSAVVFHGERVLGGGRIVRAGVRASGGAGHDGRRA